MLPREEAAPELLSFFFPLPHLTSLGQAAFALVAALLLATASATSPFNPMPGTTPFAMPPPGPWETQTQVFPWEPHLSPPTPPEQPAKPFPTEGGALRPAGSPVGAQPPSPNDVAAGLLPGGGLDNLMKNIPNLLGGAAGGNLGGMLGQLGQLAGSLGGANGDKIQAALGGAGGLVDALKSGDIGGAINHAGGIVGAFNPEAGAKISGMAGAATGLRDALQSGNLGGALGAMGSAVQQVDPNAGQQISQLAGALPRIQNVLGSLQIPGLSLGGQPQAAGRRK